MALLYECPYCHEPVPAEEVEGHYGIRECPMCHEISGIGDILISAREV